MIKKWSTLDPDMGLADPFLRKQQLVESRQRCAREENDEAWASSPLVAGALWLTSCLGFIKGAFV